MIDREASARVYESIPKATSIHALRIRGLSAMLKATEKRLIVASPSMMGTRISLAVILSGKSFSRSKLIIRCPEMRMAPMATAQRKEMLCSLFCHRLPRSLTNELRFRILGVAIFQPATQLTCLKQINFCKLAYKTH